MFKKIALIFLSAAFILGNLCTAYATDSNQTGTTYRCCPQGDRIGTTTEDHYAKGSTQCYYEISYYLTCIGCGSRVKGIIEEGYCFKHTW